ncbi:Solute-binding protein OS=Streptomyces glaucescens OX=1907 GN=SGLAU_15450 PE=4 SV=1 [Streptomyces glaucescens]
MLAFRQNGHKEQVGESSDFVYSDENVLDFSREYDLLPVADPHTDNERRRRGQGAPAVPEGAAAELYPVGKTSWAQVAAEVKRIGQAVAPGGSPRRRARQVETTALDAEARRTRTKGCLWACGSSAEPVWSVS